jgi:methionine-rich copper-binding protein CopC
MACWGRPSPGKVRTLILAAVLLLPAPPPVRAHAFPDHADPRVGSSVDPSPPEVRIWFDGEIEPVFSTIRVENENKQRVDRGDGGVSPQDNRLLAVRIRPLSSGKYRVYWSVVARDGHRTEGDYPFKVK